MYISNVDKSKVFKCNGVVYSYLKTKLPLLSSDLDYYYFAKTAELDRVLLEAPFWIKVFVKVGWRIE